MMIGSVNDFIAYAAGLGVTIAAPEAQIAMNKAMLLLNVQCWYGQQDGNDAWPRTGLVFNGSPLIDAAGNKISGLTIGEEVTQAATPLSVLNAFYALSLDANNGIDLMPTVAGAQIIEERVEGAVTMKYSEASLGAAPVWAWWDNLLGNWLLCEQGGGVNFDVFRG